MKRRYKILNGFALLLVLAIIGLTIAIGRRWNFRGTYRERDALSGYSRFILVGRSKGDWVGLLARPLGAQLIGPFVDPEYIMILAEMRKSDLRVIAATSYA